MTKSNKCVATSESGGVIGYSCCTDGDGYESCEFHRGKSMDDICKFAGFGGACNSHVAQLDCEETEEGMVRR